MVRESEMTIKDETKALHGEQPTVSLHNYNDAKPNGRDIFSAKLLPAKIYSLHVRVLMFKTFEIILGSWSWQLHSV